MTSLSDKERIDWLQLLRTKSIGPITFKRLIAQHGSAAAALDALPEISRKAGRKTPLTSADRQAAEQELENTYSFGAQLIASCETNYPKKLRAIPDPPPVIFLCGSPHLTDSRTIAIVGARNASGAGRKMAHTLASDLGNEGIVIASGLARGIDGTAHEAALSTGTIAVVAGGVDVIYPPEHGELTKEIMSRGALISERPIGYKPTARDFPRRNRLISGLSDGVIVVEAAARSGTLITARFALEQGREVFAVPGSPLDPRCQGANKLIADGATLVQDAQDIIDELNSGLQGMSAKEYENDFWAEEEVSAGPANDIVVTRENVLEFLGYTPIHQDEILRAIDAPPGLIFNALLDLVLSGNAEEMPGGTFVRTDPIT